MPEPPLQTPNLQFSVLCLNLHEKENGPPTLEALFFELPLPELPFKVSFFIINGWINGRGEFNQSIEIKSPNGTQTIIETGDQKVLLTDPSIPQMIICQMSGVVFSEPGPHQVLCSLNGKPVLQYPLTIRLARKIIERPGVPVDLLIPGIQSFVTLFPPALHVSGAN